MIRNPDPGRRPLLFAQILLVGMLFIALVLAALSDRQPSSATPAVDVDAIKTQAMMTAWARAAQLRPFESPTAEGTATTVSTETPAPTATPYREPIDLSGTGDAVIYPQKWVGPALVRITYDGAGPFVVWTQDNNAERVDQLAHTTGPYHGESLIDFLGNQRTLRFEIRTGEGWQIEVLPLSAARHMGVPGIIQGSGDAGIVLLGETPDLLTVDASSITGPFTLWAYGDADEPLVNVQAPYTGTVPLPDNTTAIAVKAIGPWSLEVTTR